MQTDDIRFLRWNPEPSRIKDIKPAVAYENTWVIEFKQAQPASFWLVSTEALETVFPRLDDLFEVFRLDSDLRIMTKDFKRFSLVVYVQGEDPETLASSSNYWTLANFAKVIAPRVNDWSNPTEPEVENIRIELQSFRRNQSAWIKNNRKEGTL